MTLCPCQPGVVALLYIFMADCLHNAGDWAKSNYTIIATDFTSRYCIIHENSANTHPNWKTVTQLMGMPLYDTYTSSALCVTQAACGWNHPKYYITWLEADNIPHGLFHWLNLKVWFFKGTPQWPLEHEGSNIVTKQWFVTVSGQSSTTITSPAQKKQLLKQNSSTTFIT